VSSPHQVLCRCGSLIAKNFHADNLQLTACEGHGYDSSVKVVESVTGVSRVVTGSRQATHELNTHS
jgi:hypothetical protein